MESRSCDYLLGVLHLMVSSSFLSLPSGFVVEQVRVLYDCVTIYVLSTAQSAACPLCSQPSTRIHSRYLRTLADLPIGGRQVVVSLTVHKFFCQTSECPRRIFAERFADLVRPWARTTLRFDQAIEAIGFTSNGEARARLATRLGLPTSPATMLRRLKTASVPMPKRITKVGIDDFGATRGRTCSCKTSERRILPGILLPVPCQAESSAPGTM